MGRYTTVQACELLLIKKRAYSSRWFSEFFHLSCGLFLSPGDGTARRRLSQATFGLLCTTRRSGGLTLRLGTKSSFI